MDALALARQAEAQNATTLINAAVDAGSISQDDANMLTEGDREEIGIMQTQQEVARYVYLVFHETQDQRNARRAQERVALQGIREDAFNEMQGRAIARANTIGANGHGGKRRRRRTRKSRL